MIWLPDDSCLGPHGFEEGVFDFQTVQRLQTTGALGEVPGQGVGLRVAQRADGKLLEVIRVGTGRSRGHGTLPLRRWVCPSEEGYARWWEHPITHFSEILLPGLDGFVPATVICGPRLATSAAALRPVTIRQRGDFQGKSRRGTQRPEKNLSGTVDSLGLPPEEGYARWTEDLSRNGGFSWLESQSSRPATAWRKRLRKCYLDSVGADAPREISMVLVRLEHHGLHSLLAIPATDRDPGRIRDRLPTLPQPTRRALLTRPPSRP